MGIRQFAVSLSRIYRSEHTNRIGAFLRHLAWQTRKFTPVRAATRQLSRSVLTDEAPGGVMADVNMLGLYDFNNMNFVGVLLAGGGVFVDVGANIGVYTLLGSENPDVVVISLEPNPVAYRKLIRNLELNARVNAVAINCGASSRPGDLLMTNNPADPTNHVVSDSQQEGPTIRVVVDTLDAICGSRDVVPKLIKIDVEGHELEVLKGATVCLAATTACLIENGDRAAVVDLLIGLSMRGPFYYIHREHRLSRQQSRLKEDPVFIGRDFQNDFPEIAVEV